ncbi:MAG TPA: non-reducing end alpha-L-arabinofuranosidase family hydrolase [Planctomycetia bacterium]|nr:non-reducing end alpha-L-arabinofuranosidase family hydrolase [Planctomycetia bacterium]
MICSVIKTPAAIAGLFVLSMIGSAEEPLLAPPYRWKASGVLVASEKGREDPCHAIKDPTVVRHDGKWHVFATIRSKTRTHQIEYLAFEDWAKADGAKRHVLTFNPGYFCAPQVFYFTPHRKWYLIHQIAVKGRKPELQPAFSTSEKIDDPNGWSASTPLVEKDAPGMKTWIDFWVICDEEKAHLFFTSFEGKFWRAETKLADFPRGWTTPQVVLEGDFWEAAHVYKVKGSTRFFAMIEAEDKQRGNARYYKAYAADKLDGKWRPLADSRENPFASRANLAAAGGETWSDSVSHGELLRTGFDERLEVDPVDVKFLYQGVSDTDRRGKAYGEIPWKLGILELAPPG